MVSSWEHQILVKDMEGSVDFYLPFRITQQKELVKGQQKLERAWEGQSQFILVCGSQIKQLSSKFLPNGLIVINRQIGVGI